MRIKIPNNYINERKYIVTTIITDFLGVELDIEFHNENNYIITLPNDKKIIINDNFFSSFIKEKEYLNKKNIPSEIIFAKNNFTPEKDIPVIYGNEKIEINKNKIICGIDIFASTFFMLTRWEEYVITEKDKYERFPDKLSLAYKNNFHKRPVVNEYVEMLWNMIYSLDKSVKRKERKYSAYITHDVDEIRRYNSLKKYIKAIAGDIILRKNPLLWFKTTYNFISYNLKISNDPYDTFNYLMKISEKYNLKSHFYFIPSKENEIDARYNINSKVIKNTIKNILNKNHYIGVHAGYNSFNKPEVFKNELNRFNEKIIEGRQHYLRFENPTTWQIWENENLKFDSTIGFSEFAGFRAGTCFEYNIFNIITSTKLRLIEKPLIAMEGAIKEEFTQTEEFIEEFKKLKEIIKKYEGNFVFLWHNNNLNTTEWQKYSKHYENIISIISH